MVSLNKLVYLFFIPLLAAFLSCSARITGKVSEGGAAEFALETSLEPRALSLISTFRLFAGQATDAPILDGESISRSLAAVPGIRSVSLRNTGPAALAGNISISNVGDFLAPGDSRNRFVIYTEGSGAGTSSIVLILDRNSAPELIYRLSPEAEEYLLALMAPVVLGETSTRQEYLSLISSIYGRPLADEIAAARVRAFIEVPRPLINVQGGTARGNIAEFDIPLLDILVLEHPLRYELNW
jgi:hypothetical protein